MVPIRKENEAFFVLKFSAIYKCLMSELIDLKPVITAHLFFSRVAHKVVKNHK